MKVLIKIVTFLETLLFRFLLVIKENENINKKINENIFLKIKIKVVILQKFKHSNNMESVIELAEIKTQNCCTGKKQLYSVEEVFDRIDNKFINFYGEYGRKIVNERRFEWNQDEIINLKML